MTSKRKKGLGRGFDSLIPTEVIHSEFDSTHEHDSSVSTIRELLIQDVIPNPDQPRRTFHGDALQELANSLKEHGVLQPIVVIEHNGNYRIVAGERRWRAAQLAGMNTIPAIIRSMDGQTQLEVALIENVQREDLTPLEMATSILKLQEQFNLTINDIAKRVGKATSTVSNVKRLLRLPDAAKRALNELKISEQHARAILSLDGEPKKQQELLDHIIKHDWTANRAEQFVKAYKLGATSPKEAAKRTVSTNTETKKISKKIKAPVSIRHMAKGGRLIITFKDDKDYERLTKMLS